MKAVAIAATAVMLVVGNCRQTTPQPVTHTCGGADLAGGTVQQTITSGGRSYPYFLDLPAAGGDTRLPVVFDFPGLGEHAKEEAAYSHLAEQAAARGWIGVTPQASGAITAWTLPPLPGPDDVAFFNTLLSHLESSYCVDKTRIYAAGISNGASFTGVLACQPNSRLAAIGMVAGINGYAVCADAGPMPVVGFNGTADPIVPFNGGNVFGGADQQGGGVVPAATVALADWAARNGCRGAASTTSVAPDVQLVSLSGCTAAAELYVLVGGGHTWPGAAPVAQKLLGPTNSSISATKTMLDFFASQHR